MPEPMPQLPFEIDDTIDPALVTGRAGVPLVIELFRQLGVAQAIDTHVAVKHRQRGLSSSQLIESLMALWVSGGDRCQDLTTLREDAALAILLGYLVPAATNYCVLCMAEALGEGSVEGYLEVAKALRRVGAYHQDRYATFTGMCETHTGPSGTRTFWMIRNR